MTTDMDTLAAALYVRTGDLLKESPHLAPLRPASGKSPQLSDAELVTLAVLQALPGFTSEARRVRYAGKRLRHLSPYVPLQPGCNKRLRAARGLVQHCILALACSTGLRADDVWAADSAPVECGRSRETVKRSDLAGWAEYGYCASHSRWLWGLRLHLVTTLHGLPVGYAPAGAKAGERQVLPGILGRGGLPGSREGQVIIAGKGYYGREFEAALAEAGLILLRPARKGEDPQPGSRYFRPLRQLIESVNDTFKGQPDLERHGGRTVDGVTARVLQRILALTAAIWHNDAAGQPVMRSLVAYDH